MTAADTSSLLETDDPAPFFGVREVLRLAWPSVLNTVSLTVMQFIDGFMVSTLGDRELGAQMGGAMTHFVPVVFFMGIVSCVNTFASQHLGAGRPKRAAAYGWQGIWLSLAAGAFLFTVGWPLAPKLFALAGHEAPVQALETQYFRILLFAGGFVLAARAIGNFFIGIHLPTVPLAAGVIANVVNVVVNYGLIFGKFGLPELGFPGAAIGTVIGCTVEALILFGLFTLGALAREYGVWKACRLDLPALKDLLKVGSPAGAAMVGDVLMWTIFTLGVVASFGTKYLAAGAILSRYMHLCFMPAIGVSIATTAIVGRHCGANRTDLARRRTYAAIAVVELYVLALGTLLWVFRDPLVGVFNRQGDPHVQAITTGIFFFIPASQAFDGVAIILIGALRGAGDTFWPAVIHGVCGWGVGLGGAALVRWLAPGLGVAGPYCMMGLFIALLAVGLFIRFRSGAWRKISLAQPGEAPLIPGVPVPPPDETA